MIAPHPKPSADAIADIKRADALQRQGHWKQALALYQQIAAEQPGLSDIYSRMGLIFLQQRQWQSAVDCYQQALSKDPAQAVLWYNLAQAFEELGKPQKALEAYHRALLLEPNYCEALYNMGRLHLLQGDFSKAVDVLTRCVETAPDFAPAHNNLGQALFQMNALDQAIICYKRACELDPGLGTAWFNLAEIYHLRNALDKAIDCYQRAIAVQVDPTAAYNNLGNLFKKQGDYRQAADCYQKVVSSNPDLAEGHYNLGSAMRLLEDYEKALKHLSLAVQMRPDYAQAWNNLALTCKNIGELDRALTCFNRAVTIDPNLAVAHWNRSFIYLLKEEYLNGWKEFEWRFKIPNWKSLYPLRPKSLRWDGRPNSHATILIHDEQGMGDTLQFVRYLPLVKEHCARIILETRRELVHLLRSAAGIDEIVIRPNNEKDQVSCDFHIPLMSLPGLFQTTPQTIPGEIPYIHADPDKAAYWSSQLSSDGLRIGLVWAGRPQHTNDHNRSCCLSELLPLLSIENITFVSLQKGPAAAQLKTLLKNLSIIDLDSQLNDFSDTAAVLMNLDLLVTVDTAVAHLAGAMGKSVWVLIPFIADWRWGARRGDSPWYPSMRLFRQTRPGDWQTVIRRVQSELVSIQK